ncbi:hypothetical protein IH785_10245 [candidate division KSB1 bacterium]|nr:hypothetical protein [candidate division KSB1 bacterium]
MISLEKSTRAVLRNCFDLKPNESLLIVTDKSLADVGETIWKTALRISKNSLLLKFSNGTDNQLPEAVQGSLAQANACFVLTSKPLDEKTFNKARRNGSRILVLQNATGTLIERTFETNYKKINNISRKISDLFSIGKSLHLQSPSGTEARLTISRMKGIAETGVVQQAGEFASLPAGEACVILNHKHINGMVAIDRIAGIKKLANPITLNVKEGEITQIKGGHEADELRKAIRKFGPAGRQIYEFGVGTNPGVKLGNSAQEDEKALGTIHVSFGQNKTTKVHGKMVQAIKGILLKPTLSVDGKLIVEKGRIVV